MKDPERSKRSSGGVEGIRYKDILYELECSHEEADIHMLLHAKYASGPVVIHADATHVFILLLGHSSVLSKTYMKVGKGSTTRIIDIDEVRAAIT